MATSSITHNFIIKGKKNIITFANAIEESAKKTQNISSVSKKVQYTEIKNAEEFKNFLSKR